MKMKKFLSLTLALIMTFALAVPAFAADTTPPDVPDPEEGWIMPLDLSIASGNLIDSNTGLEISKTLNRDNGQYVNLYVQNLGSTSVKATINGQNAKTFRPGQSGHISLEVTQGWFGLDKSYEFKVVSATNGGVISIHYEIAQRDSQ